jgi:hypothetical protein
MLAHDRKKRKESGTASRAEYKPRATNHALEKTREGDAGEEKTGN